jgi:23S rRNA (cytosine1962-C5)-methyltransferase
VFRKVEGQIDDVGDDEAETTDAGDGQSSSSNENSAVTFLENGIRFAVDPQHGQKTGFFLDQRINRARIGELAGGRRVLNAFCYTGAFSVYALQGGATHVLSVDASKAALEMCVHNVELNVPGASHETLAEDCFAFLPEMPDSYDLVILDPPAFVKHQRALQRGLRGYETINSHALRRMPSGGLLATFSCSQLVTRDLFRDTVQRAAVNAGRAVRILEFFGQAPCHPVNLFHPEGEYLKGLLLYVE